MINPEALKENIKHEIEVSKQFGDDAFRCTYDLAEAIVEYIDQEITLRKSIECEASKLLNRFTENLKSLEMRMYDYHMDPIYQLEEARRKSRIEAGNYLWSIIDKILKGEKK